MVFSIPHSLAMREAFAPMIEEFFGVKDSFALDVMLGTIFFHAFRDGIDPPEWLRNAPQITDLPRYNPRMINPHLVEGSLGVETLTWIMENTEGEWALYMAHQETGLYSSQNISMLGFANSGDAFQFKLRWYKADLDNS